MGSEDGSSHVVVGADGVRHLSRAAASALLGLVRAGSDLDAELDERLRTRHDLSLRSFEVLLHLAVFSPGDCRLPMAELTRQAPLSQSRVSRLTAQLESQGFVRRTRDLEDARGVVVELTDRGYEVFLRAQDSHLQDLDELFFSVLTAAELEALAAITAKLIRRVQAKRSS